MPAGACASRRTRRGSEPADVRSGGGHAEGEAADADPARRARQAGPAASRRPARGAGARAEEGGRRSRSSTCPALNHLFVPAKTGEVRSTGSSTSKTISAGSRRARSPPGSTQRRPRLSARSTRLFRHESRDSERNLAGRNARRRDSGRRRGAQEGRPRRRRRAAAPARPPVSPTTAYAQQGAAVARAAPRSSTAPTSCSRSAPRRPTRRACARGQVVIGFADPLGAPRGDPRDRRRPAPRCCRWS